MKSNLARCIETDFSRTHEAKTALSMRYGKNRNYIKRICDGDLENPDLDFLQELSQHFGHDKEFYYNQLDLDKRIRQNFLPQGSTTPALESSKEIPPEFVTYLSKLPKEVQDNIIEQIKILANIQDQSDLKKK